MLVFMPKEVPSDWFWSVIDEGRRRENKPTSSLSGEVLGELIQDYSAADLNRFLKDFHTADAALNCWDVWGAGYAACGGMGDDGFEYFRRWIIGRGREVFETALRKPDDLAQYVEAGDELDNEGLLGELGGFIDSDDFDASAGSAWGEPEGEPWDEDDVDEMYPKMAAKFAEAHPPATTKVTPPTAPPQSASVPTPKGCLGSILMLFLGR